MPGPTVSGADWADDATARAWTDVSPAMESMARIRLAGFVGRVRFARADLAHRLPTVGQHLDALAAAGLTDVDMPWRAFWSVLILAKKPILEEGRTDDEGRHPVADRRGRRAC